MGASALRGLLVGRVVGILATLVLLCGVCIVGAPGGAPGAAAGPAPAVTLVNAFGGTFDVYLAGALVTGGAGLAEGSLAVSLGAGAVEVAVYPHVPSPPVRDGDRTDLLQAQTVTVPAVASASIVIGHAPAGGAGLPYVSLFTDDVTRPAPATGRFVVRHTADVSPIDYEIVQMATVPWTVIARGVLPRGGEISVAVPVPSATAGGGSQRTQVMVTAVPEGATYALPPLVWATALVGDGETVIAYAAGPAARGIPVADPPDCPDPGPIPPPGAADVTTATGDVDGDGSPDEIHAWSEAVGPETVWSVGVQFAGGGSGAATAFGASGIGPVALLGAADADDDAVDEVFLSMGSSGGFDQVQIWGFVDCGFEPVTRAGATTAATFPIGVSGSSRNGVTCDYDEFGATLLERNVEPGGEGPILTSTEYRWDDLVLDQLGLILPAPAVPTTTPTTATTATPSPVAAAPSYTG